MGIGAILPYALAFCRCELDMSLLAEMSYIRSGMWTHNLWKVES